MSSPIDGGRSSFRFDLSNFLPEGHEKALKQAFYNVAAFLFVLFVFVALVAVYYVLEPFLRPLLWAVLFGSVLHPFKHSLTVVLRRWLLNLRDTGTPLALGAVTAPFKIVDNVSDSLFSFIMQYAVAVLSAAGIIAAVFFIWSFVPPTVMSAISQAAYSFVFCLSSMLEFCHGATVFVWTTVIGYVSILFFWWTPSTKRYLIIFSPFVWTVFICHLVSIAGSLRITIILVLFALIVIGFFAEVRGRNGEIVENVRHPEITASTPMQAIRSWISGPVISENEIVPDFASGNDIPVGPHQNIHSTAATPRQSLEAIPKIPRTKEKTEEKMSNYFLYGLLWACMFAQVWLHVWLLNLLLVPSMYIGIKLAALKFGIVSFLKEKSQIAWERWRDTIEERQAALIPAPLRGLWRLLVLGDQKVLSLLESSIDSFTSIVAIFAVVVFAIVGTVFLSLQIYGESVHLVSVTSSLINRTVHNSEIQQLIPDGLRDVQGTLDSMLGDAYLYARGWLTTVIRRLIDNKNEKEAAVLENQMLEVFDRVYDLWVTRDSNVSDSDVQKMASFDNLVDGLKTLNFELIINFIKENIGTFMSVIDSLWVILKGNISFAFSVITAIFSLVFGGGTAVLNFFLNFIVFSTALFYLLCASGDQYKPVELFNTFLPSGGSGTKFGRAVEEAINGVFAASFKMAAFYGLYTWLIHTLFSVKIVYIPSVLAAVFGAVPFLGAYWACLPAVLELWLVNSQIGKAGFMLACQIIPMSFVDSAIYSEITGGGHPYLTGLAIAGGVFCLGFEGALFGPMLLCVLFVVMHMYGSVIQPSCMEGTRRNSRMFSLKRMFTIE